MNVARALAVLWLFVPFAATAQTASDPSSLGEAGRTDAVRIWSLPPTPNGLRPTQSWHAVGSAPNGDLYVAGMDHKTNSALYLLPSGSDELRFVGDARSASTEAGNWAPGETAEKFHTRPLWHRGKVYVATMDRSSLDDAYLARRGFHLYAYDTASGRFADLSAAGPGGTAVPHGGAVTLAANGRGGPLYAATVPTAEIVGLDPANGMSRRLGRPKEYDRRFPYTGRFMFVDGSGTLYFSAGNPLYEPPRHAHDIYGHLYSYDPVHGFRSRPEMALKEARALEVGRCVPDPTVCIVADDKGNVYRFEEDGPTWTFVAKLPMEFPKGLLWMFQVSPDGRTAYAASSSLIAGSGPASLFALDLASGAARRLCRLDRLDPRLAGRDVATGYDSFDPDGRFAFTSFASDGSTDVLLVRVDPERLKAPDAQAACLRD